MVLPHFPNCLLSAATHIPQLLHLWTANGSQLPTCPLPGKFVLRDSNSQGYYQLPHHSLQPMPERVVDTRYDRFTFYPQSLHPTPREPTKAILHQGSHPVYFPLLLHTLSLEIHVNSVPSINCVRTNPFLRLRSWKYTRYLNPVNLITEGYVFVCLIDRSRLRARSSL